MFRQFEKPLGGLVDYLLGENTVDLKGLVLAGFI